MVPGTATKKKGGDQQQMNVTSKVDFILSKYGNKRKKALEARRLGHLKKGGRDTMYLSYAAPRLQLHVAAKVFICPPDSLTERPLDLKRLLEMKALMQAELVPRSSWRALSRRWEGNVQQGGLPDRMPPGLLSLSIPVAERQRERICASQV
jgi:hypothetical protein